VPYTLNGKKVEVPVRKVQGALACVENETDEPIDHQWSASVKYQFSDVTESRVPAGFQPVQRGAGSVGRGHRSHVNPIDSNERLHSIDALI
jgi:hypothetical protein